MSLCMNPVVRMNLHKLASGEAYQRGDEYVRILARCVLKHVEKFEDFLEEIDAESLVPEEAE